VFIVMSTHTSRIVFFVGRIEGAGIRISVHEAGAAKSSEKDRDGGRKSKYTKIVSGRQASGKLCNKKIVGRERKKKKTRRYRHDNKKTGRSFPGRDKKSDAGDGDGRG